jgi:heme-degrading monooxygenase HmoA
MEEILMIARNVIMHLKPNSTAEFTQTFQKEIIPLLRQQKGFQDEITFIVPGGQDAIGVSFWDKQENADAYGRGTYPEVVKALKKVLDGTPQVQHLEVLNSTFHNIRVFAH